MHMNADQTSENKSQAASLSRQQSSGESTAAFTDNRAEAIAQRKLQKMADESSRVKQLKSYQEIADSSPQVKQGITVQRAVNHTGLPDDLKTGVENLSGYAMNDVKVHYNSDKPSQLQAHAYAQGTDIHLGPGQEKHLPHEAWHVVQQKQGRVQPTMQLKGEINVNDDAGLENEADVMGAKASDLHLTLSSQLAGSTEINGNNSSVMSNGVKQMVYTAGTYRLDANKTRNKEVEGSGFAVPGGGAPPQLPDRAVLHETMVVSGGGLALANRFHAATNLFRNSVGLTVAINAPYKLPGERAAIKAQLTARADAMEAIDPNISVTRVLWQDGRPPGAVGSIREEVPFAELRMNSANGTGSAALFGYLGTQAKTVWRKMGDDDMPFENPNGDSEINSKLELFEDAENDKGDLVSFNYNLVPDTADRDIRLLTQKIYDAEAKAVAEVRGAFDWLQTYAIEPTTYYRGPAGADAAANITTASYERNSDLHARQIKEGASFSKVFNETYGTEQEFIRLEEAINTGAGGRLDAIVLIFEGAFGGGEPVNESALLEALEPALKAIDQSIWDNVTLTRGAKWMLRQATDRAKVDTHTEQINVIIKKHFANLLGTLGTMTVRMDARRRR